MRPNAFSKVEAMRARREDDARYWNAVRSRGVIPLALQYAM